VLLHLREISGWRELQTNSSRKTILVVDDDPGVLDYASNVLEECGYAVLTAAEGAAALVLLRDHPQIDLLFTDIVMPGLDGAEVARQACEQKPGLKVLFTSGYSADVVPAGPLLKKPYRPQQLAQQVAAILGGETGRPIITLPRAS
jgi:CheY-like chemotaxis protein